MTVMYGASPMLYGGSSYGQKVEGGPSMVRAFTIDGETSRSYILMGGGKVSKKTMILKTKSFEIPMFWSLAEAVASLCSME